MVTFDCGSLARLGDLETARQGRGRADRRRPPRLERALRHDQRHRSRRGRERRARAPAHRPSSACRSTRDAAVCLYAALVCDTGRFQYESTTPEVFELARELAAFDVPIAALSRTLFEEHRFAYLQLLAEVLAHARARRPRSGSCGRRSPRTISRATT